MTSSNTSNTNSARRRLGFLKTFEHKIEGFKRELERLERATRQPDRYSGKWPTDGMERIARGLLIAEKSYGILSVAGWAKQVLTRLESIRRGTTPPSDEDFDYLKVRIEELVQLEQEEEREALQSMEQDEKTESQEPDSPQDASSSDEDGGSRSSGPPKRGGAVVSAKIVMRDPAVRNQVIFSLRNAGFEVEEIAAGPECSSIIQNTSPDLVVLDLEDPQPGGAALGELLRRDPLTDSIPILRIGLPLGQTEYDGLPKPLNPTALVSKARTLTTGALAGSRGKGGPLSNVTLDELCDFVTSEVRAGLVDSATGDHTNEPFDMPGEAFVVASIWQLVERLRRFASQGSKGRVRFEPATHPRMNLLEADSERIPAEEVGDSLAAVDDEDLARLADLSVVVADDDPEVRSFFRQVLEEARMSVRTFPDGKSALVAIGENPPDVVLTDILMPELDGWELCNRLRRDYASKHIPIILLSWKEDFLQRVRELHAGADDYMLKEVDRRQILRRIARVLKPRLTLEQKLESNEVVTGRIERLGVLPLLSAAMQRRPNCRVTLRENWNFFELAISDGELCAISRTGTDGSTAESMPALERLLGVSSGRFSVMDSAEEPLNQFPEGTWNAVGSATERLDRLTEQVADGALVSITGFEFDSRILEIYKTIAPPKVKGALDRIVQGDLPRSLIVSGQVSPELLETLLLDLIRMGAVTSITSSSSDPPLASGASSSVRVDVHSLAAEIESAFSPRYGADKPDGAIDDEGLAELDSQQLPMMTPVPLRPRTKKQRVAPSSQKPAPQGPWPAVAAVLLVAFGIMTYLYLTQNRFSDPGQAQTAIAQAEEPAVPAIATRLPKRDTSGVPAAVDAGAETSDDGPQNAAAQALSQAASGQIATGIAAATLKQDEERDKTKKAQKLRKDKDKDSSKSRSKDRKRRSKKTKKEKGATSKELGALAVAVPPAANGLVKVLVDGKARGTAPLKVKLSPGLHELVLEVNGKKTMRMVTISSGKTKRISAKLAN